VSESEGLLGDASLDGVALAEESVEAAAEAVVVEFLGGDVPEDVGPGLRSPSGDVDQGRRPRQPGRQQQAEDLAVGELLLGIGGQVLLDDGGNP
jgi:hypothetical protein